MDSILCGNCGDRHADVIAVKLCHAQEYFGAEDNFDVLLRQFMGERDWQTYQGDRLNM